MRNTLTTTLCVFVALFLYVNKTQAQCDTASQITLVLNIDPDQYYDEVSWKVTDIFGKTTFYSAAASSSAAQVYTYCLPKSGCYTFTILDAYGDGMSPLGSYKLTLDGVVIRNNPNGVYEYSQSTVFNCSSGQYCNDALNAVIGANTSTFLQTWYTFSPTDTGTYTISTCGNTTCPTKIWIYDNCSPNLVVDSSNLGTIAYSNAGCMPGLGATLTAHLAGNKTYYVRVGYASSACAAASLDFTINYDGPVVGCTDPNSCNYEPLATVSDTAACIYPGDPGCDDLPDLSVNQGTIISSIGLSTENNSDACLVQEGCIRGYGVRNLIKFSTRIDNIGKRDYYIGEPPSDPNQPNAQFVFDACHGHWHYRGYAEYLLYDATGKRIPIGSKTGFCVLDLFCPNGGDAKYTCSTMGISVDCSDEYDKNLPCQWVDVTNLPAGQYQLVIKVNSYEEPDRNGRPEKTYENNYGTACFELTYSANGTPNMTLIPNCSVVLDCNNTPFGPNIADCEGNCNGGVLTGDVNKDSLRNTIDVHWYLNQTIAPTVATTQCNDLNADGKFSLHDAALLQQCSIHGTDSLYWGSRPACAFPIDIYNQYDRPNFKFTALNTVEKYIDIQVVNPNRKQIGFDIQLAGVHIDSVKNMLPAFAPSFSLDAANGRIIAIAETEAMLPKSTTYNNLLRVYYSSLSLDTICLTVNETVNEFYERSNSFVATPACMASGISAIADLPVNGIEIIAYPNPATDAVNVLVPPVFGRYAQLTLTNATGTTVRNFPTAGQSLFEIERKGLPSGLYILTIADDQKKAVTKVIWL